MFCRKSIYRLGGTSGSLADCNLSVVTPELGCAARRTIIQVGNKVYFLSDNGIYGLEYLDEYNLRGLELPLSEAINPTIAPVSIPIRLIKQLVATMIIAYGSQYLWMERGRII